jgi:hypothetical protein
MIFLNYWNSLHEHFLLTVFLEVFFPKKCFIYVLPLTLLLGRRCLKYFFVIRAVICYIIIFLLLPEAIKYSCISQNGSGVHILQQLLHLRMLCPWISEATPIRHIRDMCNRTIFTHVQECNIHLHLGTA